MSARLSILAYGLERRQQRRRDGPASVGSCRHMLDVLDGWAVTVGTNEGLLGRGWQVRSGTLPTRRNVVTASCEAGAKPQSIGREPLARERGDHGPEIDRVGQSLVDPRGVTTPPSYLLLLLLSIY